jgi:hypothetical protein
MPSTFITEADAIVDTTWDSLRNGLLGIYRCQHLFEADSILIHLVRYDQLCFCRLDVLTHLVRYDQLCFCRLDVLTPRRRVAGWLVLHMFDEVLLQFSWQPWCGWTALLEPSRNLPHNQCLEVFIDRANFLSDCWGNCWGKLCTLY